MRSVFTDLPGFAAWRFVDVVDGFEVVYAQPNLLRGHTSAVEDGQAYAVRYEIALDDRWRTREARVVSDTVAGPRETLLRSDGEGRWTVDGMHAPATGRTHRCRPRSIRLHEYAADPPPLAAARRDNRGAGRLRPSARPVHHEA